MITPLDHTANKRAHFERAVSYILLSYTCNMAMQESCSSPGAHARRPRASSLCCASVNRDVEVIKQPPTGAGHGPGS